MRWPAAVGFLCAAAVACVAGVASGAGGASLTARLMPGHPPVGSTATIQLSGSTRKTAIPLVLAVKTAACPARIPASGHVLVPATGVVTGGIFGMVRVHVDSATRRYCVFLVPATQDAYGKTTYVKTAAPLDTVAVAVGGIARSRHEEVVFGHTHSADSTVALTVAPGGTRITKLTVTCGGNPLHPPAIGKLFIGKRFVAKVSLPVAKTIRWSGRILPDNSSNYDVPPARWNGPVHYALSVHLVTDPIDGQPQGVTGTGTLTGPRLPCPKTRRYVGS